MLIKDIVETFGDYGKSSLLIAMSKCDFKCEIEGLCPQDTCQNSHLNTSKSIDISNNKIIKKFNNNTALEAIVFGGLEPILQFEEVYEFIQEFRKTNNEDVVIFTGYYPYEIEDEIKRLKDFDNIYLKVGRFIADSDKIYDPIGKIWLASSNQYFEKIS